MRVDPAEHILASVGADVTGLEDLLDKIIRRKLWENRKAEDGTDLSSFALLAIAPRPARP